MADFKRAYHTLLAHEGGYHAGTGANSADRGGETYKGIARVHHPNWAGWERIDAMKHKPGFPGIAETDTLLSKAVGGFYKSLYWDTHRLDDIQYHYLAEKILDIAVNMGNNKAAFFTQKAHNYLCRNQEEKKLKLDAIIGPVTVRKINSLSREDQAYMVKLLNLQQGRRYLDILDSDRSQEVFTRGWINRINLNPSTLT